MTTLIVSRHQGALDWLRESGYLSEESTRIVSDLDLKEVGAGDIIIGTLPAHLAAQICACGARYQHLSLDLPEALRGKELSADDMRACHARLEEFFIESRSVETPQRRPREMAHICLVSDQALQNIIPTRIGYFKPDRIFLLQSLSMKKKGAGERLQKALLVMGMKKEKMVIVDDCPDHDLPKIIAWSASLIERLCQEHPDTRFVLNLTGGNKLMSMGILQAMRNACEAIYCDTEHRHLEVIHPPGKPPVRLTPELIDIKGCLAAQGLTARTSKTDVRKIEARREATFWLVENANNLQNLITTINIAAGHWEVQRNQKKHSTLATKTSPTFSAPIDPIEMKTCDQLLRANQLLRDASGIFSVPESSAIYLRGGWLEEYCYLVGTMLAQADNPVDLRLTRPRFDINLEIDPIDETVKYGKFPLNELDAVFVHNNRMLIIECKTGTQFAAKDRYKDKSQHILNKLEALGEHAAGRFSTKFLLSTEQGFTPEIQDRAKRYNIRLIKAGDLPQLKDKILKWMGGQ